MQNRRGSTNIKISVYPPWPPVFNNEKHFRSVSEFSLLLLASKSSQNAVRRFSKLFVTQVLDNPSKRYGLPPSQNEVNKATEVLLAIILTKNMACWVYLKNACGLVIWRKEYMAVVRHNPPAIDVLCTKNSSEECFFSKEALKYGTVGR